MECRGGGLEEDHELSNLSEQNDLIRRNSRPTRFVNAHNPDEGLEVVYAGKVVLATIVMEPDGVTPRGWQVIEDGRLSKVIPPGACKPYLGLPNGRETDQSRRLPQARREG